MNTTPTAINRWISKSISNWCYWQMALLSQQADVRCHWTTICIRQTLHVVHSPCQIRVLNFFVKTGVSQLALRHLSEQATLSVLV